MSKKKLKKSQKTFFFSQKNWKLRKYFFLSKKEEKIIYFSILEIHNSTRVLRSRKKPWKNCKKSQSIVFLSSKFLENICLLKKRDKNAILLVLPIKEISLRPELSSPPRFRSRQGGLSITDKVRTKDGNLCV